ncbi:MAG: HPF/RaiA family ribosome-associated protein [Chitinophagaceae bacterium]|nr:HPF/RaiA family ribosome-associated protein [Chitinophagaceae bacterium]
MIITIESPGFSPRQKLLKFLQAKITKLTGICGEIIGGEVCLRLENSAIVENKTCRIRLFIPGNDLLATARAGKFETAIAQVIRILKLQISKRKTKKAGCQKKYRNN